MYLVFGFCHLLDKVSIFSLQIFRSEQSLTHSMACILEMLAEGRGRDRQTLEGNFLDSYWKKPLKQMC